MTTRTSARPEGRRDGTSPSRRPAWHAAHDRAGVVFGLPFFLGFAVIFLAPIVYAVYQSFLTVQSDGGLGLGASQTVFAGFDNYVRVFQDTAFWQAMGRVATFAVVQIPISLGLSLTAALLLDAARERTGTIYRTLLLVPYMVPAIVASLIWVYLYSPRVGPFTAIGSALGVEVNFFDSRMLWISIGNLIIWMVLGFNMLIIYGALRGVDRSVLEAARVDGAGGVRTALAIKIPMVRGTLVLTGLLSIIGMLQVFNEPLIFRGASPETVTKDFTPIMSIYFQAFTSNNYSYAAALSIVLAAVIGVLSTLFYRLGNRSQP